MLTRTGSPTAGRTVPAGRRNPSLRPIHALLPFLALLLAASPHRAAASGCGCVPVSLPVGEQARAHQPGTLRAGYGFSYSDTDHYYIGEERDDATEQNVAPATLGTEHLLSLDYDLPRGITLSAEVPFVRNEQSRKFGGVAGTMVASGLGDVRLLARYWLARGDAGSTWYAAAGVRLPTGESDGEFRARNGKMVVKDLAAQPGTGNTAGIVEFGGGMPLGGRFGLGLTARYVFTPAATTVENFRHQLSGAGPEKNSDSDAATARVSFASALGSPGSAWNRAAARVLFDFAWIPYDDLFGDTEGFRRAGPIVAVGPGLGYTVRDGLALSAAAPITVYRNVQQNGGNVQEWMLQFSAAVDLLP